MAKFYQEYDLSFSKNEHLHGHMTINKVRKLFRCFQPSSPPAATALHETLCPVLLPTTATANIFDHCGTTSQPGSTITLLPHPGGTSLAPSTPLPSLKDVGILTPLRHPCHNNNDNTTTSTTLMTMTTPYYRPPPLVNCYVSKKGGMKG